MYRDIDCPNCGRHRIMKNGICDKCEWDIDGNDYARVTHPELYDIPEDAGWDWVIKTPYTKEPVDA